MQTLLKDELEFTRELNEELRETLLEVEEHIDCLNLDLKDFEPIEIEMDIETLKAAVAAEKKELRAFYEVMSEVEEILTKAR